MNDGRFLLLSESFFDDDDDDDDDFSAVVVSVVEAISPGSSLPRFSLVLLLFSRTDPRDPLSCDLLLSSNDNNDSNYDDTNHDDTFS